jgi:hypothetical protein
LAKLAKIYKNWPNWQILKKIGRIGQIGRIGRIGNWPNWPFRILFIILYINNYNQIIFINNTLYQGCDCTGTKNSTGLLAQVQPSTATGIS